MLSQILRSSVFHKIIMALTGVSLVLFVITHLAGNLSLYFPDGTPFNRYAHMLASMGPLLYVAEIGLIGCFILHAAMAIHLKMQNKRARPVAYRVYQSKGGPSKANLSSLFMPVTGATLLCFLILHIWQFKFGPGLSEGYIVTVDGIQVRDLHRLIIETFQNPLSVGFYTLCMLFLGFHLRHGIWSAFQSLGLKHVFLNNLLYKLAFIVALIISLGFMGIPIWIYINATGVIS